MESKWGTLRGTFVETSDDEFYPGRINLCRNFISYRGTNQRARYATDLTIGLCRAGCKDCGTGYTIEFRETLMEIIRSFWVCVGILWGCRQKSVEMGAMEFSGKDC